MGVGLRDLTRTKVSLPSGPVIAPSSSQLSFSHTLPLVHQQVLPALLPQQIPNLLAPSCVPCDHASPGTTLSCPLYWHLICLTASTACAHPASKQAERSLKKRQAADIIPCSKPSSGFPSYLKRRELWLPKTFGGEHGATLASHHM